MSDQQALDRVFMALADTTRRELVRRLAQGEASIGELAEPFDMSLAAVSKHIKTLEQAGLVSRRIEGRCHFLSLVPERLSGALDWISIYRYFWQQRLDRLESALDSGGKPAATKTKS